MNKPKLYGNLAYISLTLSFMAGAFTAGVATELVTMDRSWWNDEIPEASRVYVIEGAIDAYQSGWGAGATQEGVRIIDEAKQVLPASANAMVYAIVYRKEPSGIYASFTAGPKFSKTFGDYESEVTGFYTAYPNAGDAELGDILGCLADTPFEACSDLAKPH